MRNAFRLAVRKPLECALVSLLVSMFPPAGFGQAPNPAAAAKPDALGRDNPRSAVTGFMEACRDRNYDKASQFLDLGSIDQKHRAQRGPALARQLESIL